MIVYIVLDKFKSVRYNVHVGDGTMLNTNITKKRRKAPAFRYGDIRRIQISE